MFIYPGAQPIFICTNFGTPLSITVLVIVAAFSLGRELPAASSGVNAMLVEVSLSISAISGLRHSSISF